MNGKRRPPGIDRIAEGTSPEVVDFAERTVFSQAETVPPRPADAPRRSLQTVIRALHESEINAGLQTFFDAGVRVWLGDEMNGRAAEGVLDDRDAGWADDGSIAHWLHETALRLYPESAYARAQRS